MVPKRMVIGLAAGAAVVAVLALMLLTDPARPGSRTADEGERAFPYADARNRTLRDVTARIAIQRRGERTVLEKGAGGRWLLAEPVRDRADDAAVAALLDALRDLEIVAAVPLRTADLEPYGLQQPVCQVALRAGERDIAFALGDRVPGRSPKEQRVYLRVGSQDRVAVVDASILAALDRDADAFRDRRVFPQGVVQARRVAIAWRGVEVAIEDRRDRWYLDEPRSGKVKSEALVALLKAVHELRIGAFLGAGDGPHGFQKPWFACALETWDGTATTLEAGGPAGEDPGVCYARRVGGNAVFTLRLDDLRGLQVTADDLRETEDVKP